MGKDNNPTVEAPKQEKSAKKRKLPKIVRWLIIIAATVAGALLITTLITLPYIKGELLVTNEGTVKVKKYGDYENDNRWVKRDDECCGIKCTVLYNPHEKTEVEEYMKYMKFSSKSKAKKAFELLREQGYYDIEEEGENYFIGWQKGVEDAASKEMVCLCDKMIVSSELFVSSEMARAEDDDSPSSWDFPERKQFMLDNFVR